MKQIALVAALCGAYVASHARAAHAGDRGGDDDGDDGDDDGGSGNDQGDDDDSGDDKDQPPVTAGGLFTLKTYPQNEILRPLTMTEGITQIRVGVGTDISAKGAFGSYGATIEGQYGLRDNFTLIGGLTDAYNFKQFEAYAGFEGSLVYDLLDIRVAADVHRNAYPIYLNYCSPLVSGDVPGLNPTCQNSNAMLETLPSGKYGAGGTKVSLDIGFPFRYAFRPQIALILGQSLISIDFNSVSNDHYLLDMPMGSTTYQYEAVPNGYKPDLNLTLGLELNPIPQLSIVATAALKIADFDPSGDNFQIPVTLRVEGSLSRQLDLGLEFTLVDVNPPDPVSAIDNRYVSIYGQARF